MIPVIPVIPELANVFFFLLKSSCLSMLKRYKNLMYHVFPVKCKPQMQQSEDKTARFSICHSQLARHDRGQFLSLIHLFV
jgi:hypothetical protein